MLGLMLIHVSERDPIYPYSNPALRAEKKLNDPTIGPGNSTFNVIADSKLNIAIHVFYCRTIIEIYKKDS